MILDDFIYYQDNYITLYNCSYLDAFPFLLDDSIDLILTDPPFGINYQNEYTKNKLSILIGDQSEFSYEELGKHAYRILKQNTAIFAFTGWSKYPQHFNQLQISKFLMKEPLIIQKRPGGSYGDGVFQPNADWILFGHKGNFKFQKTNLLKNKKAGSIPNKGRKPVPEFKTKFPSCWFGKEFPWSTENPSITKKFKHPTIKTIRAMEWIICLSSKIGNIILDPFCGSGTTLIAAKKQKRKCIGFEIKKEFCDVTVQRIKTET